jgi:hypothetical protein
MDQLTVKRYQKLLGTKYISQQVGAVIAGLIGGWIDLIQGNAGLDIATFHEVTF